MIKFRAEIQNSKNDHQVVLKTMDNQQSIHIPPKSGGFGSSVNGAEALFFALATCYCNDIYREAEQKSIAVSRVTVEVEGDYDGVSGHPVENIVYHATVEADAPQDEIESLMKHTDALAEIQNTLRQGVNVTLSTVNAISTQV